MFKRISKPNLKWTLSWLTLAVLTLVLWSPLRSPPDLPSGPPWIYGKPDARFTLRLYADLECPFCQDYLPGLQRWIDHTPEVNLQWHHLPLPQHEPAASTQARLAECVGEIQGREGFWQAIAWIYRHTQGSGNALPKGLAYPDDPPSIQTCLDSERPGTVVQAQKAEATKNGLIVTPSLRLTDNHSQRHLQLQGPIEPDALLSALDLLATPETNKTTEMPADLVSDMPR